VTRGWAAFLEEHPELTDRRLYRQASFAAQPGRGIKPRSDELVGSATNTVALIVPGVLIETTSANSLFSQLRA
jgi:hypothetical protein